MPSFSRPAFCSRLISTAKGDAASNYGSAGAGIAHEISHSFDELGNIYDAQGRLGNWWTAEDSGQVPRGGGEAGGAI